MEIFDENNKELEKKKVEMRYRVLLVCTKRLNKWFMILDKKSELFCKRREFEKVLLHN